MSDMSVAMRQPTHQQLETPFVSDLTLENVVSKYKAASPNDRNYCLSFLDFKAQELFSNDNILRRIPRSMLHNLLKRDTFYADESEILVAVSNWIRGRWKPKRAQLGKHIRWNFITEYEFQKYGGFISRAEYYLRKKIIKRRRVKPYHLVQRLHLSDESSDEEEEDEETVASEAQLPSNVETDEPRREYSSDGWSLTSGSQGYQEAVAVNAPYPGFERDLTVENVAAFCLYCLNNKNKENAKICLEFFDKNIKQLFNNTPVLKSLSKDVLIELLKRDTFFAKPLDEVDILSAVLAWSEAREDSHIKEVLEYVRWNYIPLDFFQQEQLLSRLLSKEQYEQWSLRRQAARYELNCGTDCIVVSDNEDMDTDGDNDSREPSSSRDQLQRNPSPAVITLDDDSQASGLVAEDEANAGECTSGQFHRNYGNSGGNSNGHNPDGCGESSICNSLAMNVEYQNDAADSIANKKDNTSGHAIGRDVAINAAVHEGTNNFYGPVYNFDGAANANLSSRNMFVDFRNFYEIHQEQEEPFVCKHCYEKFKCESDILDHWKAYRVKFRCPVCGMKYFSRYSKILKHQEEHRCGSKRFRPSIETEL